MGSRPQGVSKYIAKNLVLGKSKCVKHSVTPQVIILKFRVINLGDLNKEITCRMERVNLY